MTMKLSTNHRGEVSKAELYGGVLLGIISAAAVVTWGTSALALLALPIVVAAHLNQRVLTCLLVFSMFVTRPSFDAGPATVRLEIIVCGLAFMDLIFRRRQRTPDSALNASAIFVPAIGWILYLAVVSALNSIVPSASLSTLAWMLASAVGAVWLFLNSHLLPLFLKVGGYLTFIFALLAVGAYGLASAGISFVGVQPDPTYGGYASYVLSIEANILAILLTTWTLLAAANPMRAFSPKLRMAIFVVVPLALFATHTRIAFVALAVGIAILSLKSARALSALVLGALATTLLLPVVIAVDPGAAKFDQGFNFDSGTEVVRAGSWETAISQISASTDTFITGLGFNSYGQRNYDTTFTEGVRESYLGNIVLQIMYDGGLIGSALFVAFLVGLAATSKGRWKSRQVLAVAVPYLIMSVSTSSMWLYSTWFLVGIAAALSTTSAVKPEEPRASSAAVP